MKKLLILIACGFASLSYADDYSGAYFNINLGAADPGYLANWEEAASFNVGYDFNRYFALEGGYTYNNGGQYDDYAGVTSNILDLAIRGTLPLGDVFGLYGRLGAGYMMNNWVGNVDKEVYPNCVLCQNTAYNNSFVGLAAIGLSFSLNRNFDLRLEDTFFAPTGTTYTGNINMVTLGFQYNFNSGKNATAATSVNDYSMLPPPVATPAPVAPTTIAAVPVPSCEPVVTNEVTPEENSRQHQCTFTNPPFHILTHANGRQYINVRACDTLYFVAKQTGVSVAELKKINGLTSDKIEIGTKLYLSK